MKQNRVIALGFFDGVHLGHGALLRTAVMRAADLQATSAALLFDEHPDRVIGKSNVSLLNTCAEREHLMRRLYHVEEIIRIPFNDTLRHMPWDVFVRDFLHEKYHACHLVAGYDYRFGYQGEGNGQKLASLCQELGIGSDIVDCIIVDRETVSSTKIREFVAKGEMEQAARFLGHLHTLESKVRYGVQLGRTLGIPTINQHFEDEIQIPHFGVYITHVIINSKVYYGVTSVGVRPTVSNQGVPKAETHILDYEGDLYNQLVRVEFVKMIRGEMKFKSVQQLKEQIEQDILRTRAYCNSR